jgi:hypothetical protein
MDADPRIGFIGHSAQDSYVVNLMIDKVWGQEGEEGAIRQRILDSIRRAIPERKQEFVEAAPPPPPEPQIDEDGNIDDFEASARTSLPQFLNFCADNYPAEHYMLFIIGHGLVVGNDTFLFDENAREHFLSLTRLGKILQGFKKKVVGQNAQFELVSFHSCSMSSLEVAYELQYEIEGEYQGTANYMLAAQGPSFVGSWPYRQILIRIFNHVARNERGPLAVKELLRDIFFYCLYNSYDFIVAGYNFDVCLCDLNKVLGTRAAIADLSKSLIAGLSDPQIKERILLAHLDAQSFWLENYVDLFDFCRRVRRRLRPFVENRQPEEIPTKVRDIRNTCSEVIKLFRKGNKKFDDLLVVRSEFAGSASQYAQGLSVFLPWAQPVRPTFWPNQYDRYRLTTAFEREESWTEFVKTYFEETKRRPRADGENDEADDPMPALTLAAAPARPRQIKLQEELLERFATSVFDRGGQLAKGSPTDSQGDSCDCPSIKNFPAFTREPRRGSGGGGTVVTKDEGTLVGGILADPDALKQSNGQTFSLDGVASDE